MPRCQKNPRPPDATPGKPGLEPPNEPRQDQDRLEIRPPGRASQIRLQKELFHAVKALATPRWRSTCVRFSSPNQPTASTTCGKPATATPTGGTARYSPTRSAVWTRGW